MGTIHSSARLGIEREDRSGCIVYRLRGRFSDHVDAIHQDVKVAALPLVFDVAGLESVSSNFIGLLVFAQSVQERRGGSVRLVGPSVFLRDLLEVTGVAQLFPVHAEVPEAEAAARGAVAGLPPSGPEGQA
ncbi:MAG: STAS domain-containing protein [Planctomycetes bacterium]|nr:STAS domain-containing protein [Planctomycetota bacterium]